MSDYLLELSKNPKARKFIKSAGLPLPIPQVLHRAKGQWEERPFEDAVVVFGATSASTLASPVARALATGGADPYVVGDVASLAAFEDLGDAFGRPPQPLDLSSSVDGLTPHALLFDASGLTEPAELRALYDFFHPMLRNLRRCGRVVVLGRPPRDHWSPNAAAAQTALSGFVRSVAKEVGKKGATANLLVVSEGAEDRLVDVLRFVLSNRSAFVTGQPFVVTDRARDLVNPPQKVLPLENKVALVTGAARGIGADTARRLSEEGAHVLCLDLPSDDAPVARLAREVGGRVLLADVADPATPTLVAKELEACGGVDIVVHNAGVTRDKTLAKMKPEYWDMAVDINLSAVTRITEQLLDGALNDEGRIICLSSVAGIAGNLGQTNYGASKSGLIGLVEALAGDLANRGVTVNAVAPGFIETRLTARIPPVIREVGRRLSALAQGGLPVDVAEVITFLSSPGAQGITGSTLRVCGGAFIGA